MSFPYITISSDSADGGTNLSTTILAPPSPDYVPASPEYVPASNSETDPFEDASRETKYDPKDFLDEDPSKGDPSKDEKDVPMPAQVAPTPLAQPSPTPPTSIIQSGRTASYRQYRLHPNDQERQCDITVKATTEAVTLPPRRMFRMTPLHSVATTEATTPRRRLEVGENAIVAYTFSITEQPIQHTIDGFYSSFEASQEDVEVLQDALVLACRQIPDLNSCLDDSEAREAALERCMRAIEEHFGPAGNS
uniref:Uncharacterized protein n=1 Tax=Tanacetum cinerariifolium TaxID=118510 RepID=A0A699GQ29_TANCI|nr:hypothetical protein [Tanacetum cinerariifolium]